MLRHWSICSMPTPATRWAAACRWPPPCAPGTHVFIARCAGAPAGLAICFEGYSTFAGAPLLNIHDFAVVPARRGQGVGRALLAAVETAAQALGCCKITLEVLSGNGPAQALYVSAGFAPYALDPAIGHALLMQKPLGAK